MSKLFIYDVTTPLSLFGVPENHIYSSKQPVSFVFCNLAKISVTEAPCVFVFSSYLLVPLPPARRVNHALGQRVPCLSKNRLVSAIPLHRLRRTAHVAAHSAELGPSFSATSWNNRRAAACGHGHLSNPRYILPS